jgi:tetratricopeptide (TPR) repeat protein
MAATPTAKQKLVAASRPTGSRTPPVGRSLAQALGVDDNELGLLELLFVEATAEKGVSGHKIFARLRKGAAFGQALDISKAAVETLYSRAYRWSALGRHDKAEAIFRTLCIIDGKSEDFWTGLGICLRARSAWDEALAAFATASDQRPQWAVPHFHALELCIRRADWTRAATELAAFDRKADGETHPALTAEAERYRKVLALRGSSRDNGVSNP